jgi:hypothetical protein
MPEGLVELARVVLTVCTLYVSPDDSIELRREVPMFTYRKQVVVRVTGPFVIEEDIACGSNGFKAGVQYAPTAAPGEYLKEFTCVDLGVGNQES